MNRTGTTFLHNLLAQDDRMVAPLFYEMSTPLAASGTAANTRLTLTPEERAAQLKAVEDQQEVLCCMQGSDELTQLHHSSAAAPEEDFVIFEQTFRSWLYEALADIPSYHQDLVQKGMMEAYAYHKQFLQLLQHQHRLDRVYNEVEGVYNEVDGAEQARRWVLKYPFHLMNLPELFATYPDAKVIQTHRPLEQALPSWFKLVLSLRQVFSGAKHCKPHIGCTQTGFMANMLERCLSFRQDNAAISAASWIDVKSADLFAQPMDVVSLIYERLGMDLTEEAKEAMETWIRQDAKRRMKRMKEIEELQPQPEEGQQWKEWGVKEAEVTEIKANAAALWGIAQQHGTCVRTQSYIIKRCKQLLQALVAMALALLLAATGLFPGVLIMIKVPGITGLIGGLLGIANGIAAACVVMWCMHVRGTK
ncbi:unnamed protein product [Chrysoparadoxa australica]